MSTQAMGRTSVGASNHFTFHTDIWFHYEGLGGTIRKRVLFNFVILFSFHLSFIHLPSSLPGPQADLHTELPIPQSSSTHASRRSTSPVRVRRSPTPRWRMSKGGDRACAEKAAIPPARPGVVAHEHGCRGGVCAVRGEAGHPGCVAVSTSPS
jgi:hypothetical protein